MKAEISTNIATTTTYFVGTHYEVAGGVVTRYYYAGSQRIAMRKDSVLYYLLSDHLGWTSVVTDANGNVVSETRYKAWGEIRYASGDMPTKYTFTGQYSHLSDFGLMFYNARWLDVYLNHSSSWIPSFRTRQIHRAGISKVLEPEKLSMNGNSTN